jgi:hypothetical protein
MMGSRTAFAARVADLLGDAVGRIHYQEFESTPGQKFYRQEFEGNLNRQTMKSIR